MPPRSWVLFIVGEPIASGIRETYEIQGYSRDKVSSS